jgi:hypothetical protein
MSRFDPVGSFHIGAATAAGDTPFTKAIPPWPGAGKTQLWKPFPDATMPMMGTAKHIGDAVAHVQEISYSTGATAHTIGILRPLNYTALKAALAPGATAIKLRTDPGLYSTNYEYPSAAGKPFNVADNPIAAGDFVMIQLADGKWHASAIASGTFAGDDLVLATAIPDIAGGGALEGQIVYFFGIVSDSNPADGSPHPQVTLADGLTLNKSWSDFGVGVVVALHPGDPMLFYSPNTTDAGTLHHIRGVHKRLHGAI